MNAEGGCLCGAVRFSVEGAPLASIICHCRSCRKASAAPSVGWLTFGRARFTLLAGDTIDFASSPGVTRSFCRRCGTPLFYANEKSPDELDVTTVSLDDPSRFPPSREVWLSHKLDWEATNARLGQYPKGSDAGPGPMD